MTEKKGFWKGVGAVFGAFFSELWAFLKDSHTDSQNKWDMKLVIGTGFLAFSIYYIGWMKLGDISGFIAIAGFGAFLHGWAASPWGGSSPLPTPAGLPITIPPPVAVINGPVKEGP